MNIRPDPKSTKIRSLPKRKEPRRTVIDWKGYFLEFCKVHGEPVQYKGILLFRDGWRYGMEYSGPEHKPSVDHKELQFLIFSYWSIRLRTCKEALNKVWVERDRIQRIADQYSEPLRQLTTIGAGKDRRQFSSEYDSKRLDERIRWLQADIEECEKELKTVMESHRGASDGASTGAGA